MIRLITTTAALLLGLAVFAAIAQTLQSGGGATATGIIGSCGATSGQMLFSNSGSCAGTTNVTYSSVGSGRVSFGQLLGNTNSAMIDDSNSRIGLGPATALAWGNINATGTYDTGISRHATAGIIDIGNGTAGNISGGVQTGNATLTTLTTGTNADFLCLNAGGGILIQTTACTISSLRFKPDWKPYQDDAIGKIAKMDVGTFHLQIGPNADPNAQSLQVGLNAEDIARIAPECAIYENDMKTPKSYRQECVIALLVKAIQQLREK